MIGAISNVNSYYGIYRFSRPSHSMAELTPGTQAAAASGTRVVHRAADPETPVQPIQPVLPVNPDAAGTAISDNSAWFRNQMAEMAVRMRIQYADSDTQPAADGKTAGGIDSLQKAGDEGRCETCEKRKYQDGSDDPSVSYQTPTRIHPDAAASAVRGHEMEHVAHEQAQALREDRKVVSQSVTLHTDICPECGRVFVSGGTTRTVTKGNPDPEEFFPESGQEKPLAA